MTPRLLLALAAFVAALVYALYKLRHLPPQEEREARPSLGRGADPHDRLLATMRAIPPGRVLTVAHLAQLAGMGHRVLEAGRIVQRVEHEEHTEAVPWWRVVRKDGRWGVLPGTSAGDRQQALLEGEGVAFVGGRIPLDDHEWRP